MHGVHLWIPTAGQPKEEGAEEAAEGTVGPSVASVCTARWAQGWGAGLERALSFWGTGRANEQAAPTLSSVEDSEPHLVKRAKNEGPCCSCGLGWLSRCLFSLRNWNSLGESLPQESLQF